MIKVQGKTSVLGGAAAAIIAGVSGFVLPGAARADIVQQSLAPLVTDQPFTTTATTGTETPDGTDDIALNYFFEGASYNKAALTFDLSAIPDDAQILQLNLLFDVVLYQTNAGWPSITFRAGALPVGGYDDILAHGEAATSLAGVQFGQVTVSTNGYLDLGIYGNPNGAATVAVTLDNSDGNAQSVFDDAGSGKQLTLVLGIPSNPIDTQVAIIETLEGQTASADSPLASRLIVTYAVPEPASLALIGGGMVLMGVRRRRSA